MGMGIRKYPLPGGDRDGSKVVYTLGLEMGMEMNFYYGNGDEIMIPVPAPPRCHPYYVVSVYFTMIWSFVKMENFKKYFGTLRNFYVLID